MDVRKATADDIDDAVAVDRRAFGEPLPRKYFEAWLDTHPDGFVVASEDDRLVGYAMAIRVARDDVVDSWHDDTGNGFGTTHNPDGDILYGVSLAASGALWAGRALLDAAMAFIAARPGLERFWFYGRLPGFGEWYGQQQDQPELEYDVAHRYVETGRDPLQRYYERIGFRRLQPVLGYLPEDADSLGVALKFER